MALISASATVELLLNGVWTDITQYVYLSGGDGIQITRGRQDEASSPQAATCRMVLKNADGRFSPRNASGAYYPYVTRNTQLRVTVSGAIRFWGVVSQWPVDWDPSGQDVRVAIQADGPRRRLSRANVLYSALRRAVTRLPSARPAVGYWPLEDPATATKFTNVASSNYPGSFSGSSVALAASSQIAGSAALPTMGDLSTFRFPVPYYTPSGTGSCFVFALDATVASGAISIAVQAYTTGSFIWEIDYAPTADQYTLSWINASTGVTTGTSGAIVGGYGQGTSTMVALSLAQSGGNIAYSLLIYSAGETSGHVVTSGTVAGTAGRYSTLWFFNGTGMATTLGHVYVQNVGTPDPMGSAIGGNAGETAMARVSRLSSEEGVTAVINPSTAVGELVGVQGIATYLSLVDAAMAVDMGVSTETVDAFGLTFRSRSSELSKAASLSFAYAELEDVQPVDDDQSLQNDVTVQRDGGLSARSIASGTGLDPADVGTYATSVTLSLYTDDQVQGQADWRVYDGTVNRPRVAPIVVDATNGLAGGKLTSLLALREGDTIDVTGAPAYSGLGTQPRFLVAGWSETITSATWVFQINAYPSVATSVLIWDDATYGLLDSGNVWGL